MALTKVGGDIIKEPLDIGNINATTVQIGTATTIHTTGIDLGSGNLTGHNIHSTGIVTATSFVGPVTGNADTATTATNLTNAANINTGTISNDRLPATITKNLTGNVTGNVTGNADTASNLTGSPSIIVTDITASGNVSIAGTLTYEDVTNIDSVGIVTARTGIDVTGGHIDLVNNSRIKLGAGDDLQIYHDGTDTFIDNDEGDLYIRNTGDDIIIRAADDVLIQTQASEGAIIARGDGQVELYHNNNIKLETTTTGAKVTGALEVTQEYPSIRPTLDLNFAATKTLDRRITFTRDSLGTFTDDMGIVRYASNNVPRFDHDPTTGESLGLLIEESRTNHLGNSEMLANWAVGVAGDAFSASSGSQLSTNPDGSSPAYYYIPTSSAGYHRLNRTVTVPTLNTNYVVSLFVKRVTAGTPSNLNRYIELEVTGQFSTNSQGTGHTGTNGGSAVTFDMQDLVIESVTDNSWGYVGDAKIENYGNGWYRLSYVFNPGIGSNFTGYVWWGHCNSIGGDDGTETGNGSPSFYFWGASVEKGSFITSHIATSANSSVTRAADFAKITGTNFTDFYNQNEGTFFIDSDVARGSAYQGYVGSTTNSAANGGPSYNFNSLMSDGDNSDILLNIWDGTGSAQAMIAIAHPSGNMKAAGAFKNNDFAFSMNGSAVSTDTSGTIDTNQDQLWIGRRPYSNLGWLNNSIKRVVYYNKRLPNAQLQGLTQQ